MERYKKMKTKDLVSKVLEKDIRGIAKAITCVENELRGHKTLTKKIKKHTGKAHVIGITGFPGTGKSTLIGCLLNEYIEMNKSVGVIAVDPSSLSGGSLLGDIARMQINKEFKQKNQVFLRSMPSRGYSGGLAKGTAPATQILDAAGYEKIIIEIVGAGQGDIDIMKIAHTSVVVLNPGLGDIQTFKGGIMEIADIYVVNKADNPQASITENEIRFMTGLPTRKKDWHPEVYKTQANNGKGVKELIEGIEKHYKFIKNQVL